MKTAAIRNKHLLTFNDSLLLVYFFSEKQKSTSDTVHMVSYKLFAVIIIQQIKLIILNNLIRVT